MTDSTASREPQSRHTTTTGHLTMANTQTIRDWRRPVRSLLYFMGKYGFKLHAIDDGEETIRVSQFTDTDIVDEITATDTHTLLFHHISQTDETKRTAVLFLVFDVDPEELVCDYVTRGGECINMCADSAIEEYSRKWQGRKCPTWTIAD